MAAFLSELESVKLRKTRIEHDSSAPRVVADSDNISNSYDAAVLHCNIEHWLPILAPLDLTFDTLLVSLTEKHARVLTRAYEEAERTDLTPEAILSGEPLNEYEATLRVDLLSPVQSALDKLGATEGNSCIVKTSSRSPKDAAARTGALERILRQSLSLASNESALTRDEDMMRVICEAEGAALCFTRAEDVLRALVLSERISQDIRLALGHSSTFEQNIVLRRWEPITIDMEFRCFMYAGRLTAISQYAYRLFSPTLASARVAVRDTIVAYFDQQLRGPLVAGGFETCIVDLALLAEADNRRRPRTIEINPFLITTDAAMFSWERERDILEGKATLEDGAEYPVLRVCERVQKGLSALPRSWKDVVTRVRQELLTSNTGTETKN